MRYRVRMILPLAVVAALVGCKDTATNRAPVPFAAVAAGAGVGAGAKGDRDIRKIRFRADFTGTIPVHSVVREGDQFTNGTIIEWHGAKKFYVLFDKASNPCDQSNATGNDKNEYQATQVGNDFLATCTVADSPIGATPFWYKIISGTASANILQPKVGPLPGDHCEGCIIDIE